jgi:hypothetical protein
MSDFYLWFYKNASLIQLSFYGVVALGLIFLGHFSR